MPKSFSIDLCWRIVWAYPCPTFKPLRNCRGVQCFWVYSKTLHLFYQTGDVQPSDGGKHGPQKLLGDDKQLILLRMILTRPGIYFFSVLQPFNGVKSKSVVILDNASIHHMEQVEDLVETQAGCKLIYLPPYSLDLNPVQGLFSQIKSIMNTSDQLFQVCSAPRALIAMAYGMVSLQECIGHIY